MPRNLLKIFLLLLTLYFALVWAKALSRPDWLPTDIEPLTVIAGLLLAIVQWWDDLVEKFRANRPIPPPRYLAAPPSHLLPGILPRPDELRQLRRQLLGADKPVVVCGVGGLGKTTFAQQFCQRYGGEFDHVVWLSAAAVFSNDPARAADNAEYFLRAFTENPALSANLPTPFDGQETDVERFRKVIARLVNVPGRLLLVVDNAPEVAARYVNDLSHLPKARILLTSRDSIHNMAAFELGTLPPHQAAQVFCNIYGQRSTDPALDELLQTYGYHTLTIELLAAYAREKKLQPTALRAELQQKGLLQLDDYHLTLPNAAKRQSLRERLLETFFLELDEAEREIMRYLCILPTDGAVIDPDLMSEDSLAWLFGKAEARVELHNVLQGLAHLHWLVERDGGYRCHPVIAETAKAQLQPDAANCGVLIKNLTALLIPNQETNESNLNCAPFAPLAEAVFKGVWKEKGDFVEEDDAVAKLAGWLDYLFSSLGEPYKALDYGQRAIAIREKVLTSEHPDLATSYNNLAENYGALGEHQKSLVHHEKALAIREKVLPAEHPDLAQSYNNLGETYRALGEHQKSLEYHQKALAIREKVLPAEHLLLATSYNNLALTYYALGEHQKSLAHNQKTLAIWEKVLPAEHPLLATSYNNLAETYGALGEHQNRLAHNQKALAIREKVLPTEHPDLAQSYNNLAATYHALGEHQKSLAHYQKALVIQEKVLPAEHPDLAGSYHNLAATYGALGEHQKRLEYNQKALAIWEKVLPAGHTDLAGSYNNLAWTYYDLGDLNKAIDFMRQALAIWEKSLPATHPHIAMARNSLGRMEAELSK